MSSLPIQEKSPFSTSAPTTARERMVNLLATYLPESERDEDPPFLRTKSKNALRNFTALDAAVGDEYSSAYYYYRGGFDSDDEDIDARYNAYFGNNSSTSGGSSLSSSAYLGDLSSSFTSSATASSAEDYAAAERAPRVPSFDYELANAAREQVIHFGWMRKKGYHNKAYKDRWFRLADNKLHYWVDEEMMRLKGSIDLKDLSLACVIDRSKTGHKGFAFKLVHPKRIYKFLVKTEAERELWLNKIKRSITVHNNNITASVSTVLAKSRASRRPLSLAFAANRLNNAFSPRDVGADAGVGGDVISRNGSSCSNVSNTNQGSSTSSSSSACVPSSLSSSSTASSWGPLMHHNTSRNMTCTNPFAAVVAELKTGLNESSSTPPPRSLR